ncbi:DNA gyrase subunit A [Candidatus Uhrbacteria bacterium RIFCSPHIGHO2_02_FULL_53_13]|uniref:DNA gyrase subunit A n=2 Tax=Candidatus Uhriibacteriota TaxID=1752732 RepID=A0A1F7U026_9BACT|nr:MAG: DNA gyrase subunit A [Candidatus Uhrbacteria bacterium RIFCSPHIGHO2_02_FULL_53_13]OGL90386.1 MAG: DNA gyrase subunit A [Candidatus Uhrbacteria bacterium RIFCSPLOWO2_02_FULL_53_10]
MPKHEEPTLIEDGGHIVDRSILKEMQSAYLDYAMSVIVSRALPDVRDGMKPVHRRILYAMWKIGLRAGGRYRKSAAVVGEVLAKYHPHGDSAVYDSMVRMAQDFSLRYPLVHGQGNFGSLDGDSAAAMRYTESKLHHMAEEMLYDIEKETVNFVPNYDGEHQEPTVLPAKLPNLLLNGTLGIAVGMATNIPPHNLTEVCDAILHLIEHPDASVDDLMEFIKGPDMPTGGIAYDANEIKQAYATGRGGVVFRAKTEIVERAGGYHILVHEIPYQVNKATLLEKIAFLVREKKIEGIRDLRDESNKEGIRIVIELKKDAYPKKVLNRLFQQTQLQSKFHMNMVALIDGVQPRLMSLKGLLEEYLKHRREVVKRRAQFDLQKAKDREHILEGLSIALGKIDQVIKVIKTSKDKDEASRNLQKKFKLSEVQSQAILEMRLQSLANLERMKIEEELQEKRALIKELTSILKSETKMLGVIADEVNEMKAKYGDERRTQIVKHGVKAFSMEDVIPDEDTMVMMTRDGYIKRISPEEFKTQKRGGKGVAGLTTKEEDVVERVFSTSTHTRLLFFTTSGRVFQLKAYDIPEVSRTAKGQAMVNFLQLAPGESVTTVLSLSEMDDTKYLVMVTRSGTIKKTDLSDFEHVRQSGLIAIKLKSGDRLDWVKPSSGHDDIILVTRDGMSIRFSEGDVRAMGRTASGVRGIRLKGDDHVAGMGVFDAKIAKSLQLLVVMKNGYGKRTGLDEYHEQSRGGLGVRTARINEKTGRISGIRIVNKKDLGDMLIMSQMGQAVRTKLASVSELGRATQGVRIMRFKAAGDAVASMALIGDAEFEG